MVEKHIKSLLYDHDCVIIPDFGGLIARYVPARIHPVKHTFSPPSKKIAFNEKLTLNDGLLISTIARHKGIPQEEAQRLVADFVYQAKYKLDAAQRFELQNIGIFRYNAERHLQFEYVEGDNLLEESFGMPEFVAQPVRMEEPAVLRTLLKEREPVQANTKQPFRRKLRRLSQVAATIALGGLTATALYFLSLQPDYNLSTLNPISSIIGNYALHTSGNTIRYTPGYVPLTAEQREAAYASLLNAAPVAETVNAWTSARGIAGTSAIALTGAADVIVPEQSTSIKVGADEPAAKEEVAVTTVGQKTGRYYIIAGGYSRLKSAETGRQALSKNNQQAKVLLPERGSKWFRVSVADYEHPAEAQAVLMNYRKKYGETLWVLNY